MSDTTGNTAPQGDGGSLPDIPATPHHDEIRVRNEKLYEQVPEIGTGWRWYDIPYRFLMWTLTSWRRKFMPRRVADLALAAANFLGTFPHLERSRAHPKDDPLHNLVLPDAVRLTQGGIWTVEFFPPSTFSALERSLRNHGWDRHPSDDASTLGWVRRARDSGSWSWSRIGTVTSPNSRYLYTDARRERLPPEFESVQFKAIQLGTSLTAVVAFFALSEKGESSLDQVWRSQHDPTLTWQGARAPRVADRYFAAIEATQKERKRLHDTSRAFLANNFPGAFAARSNAHPIVDLTFFDGLDPTSTQLEKSRQDALRALGMDEPIIYQYKSPQFPGTVLIPTNEGGGPHEPLRHCWTIAGDHQSASDANDDSLYGEKPLSAATLGHKLDSAATTLVLYHGVVRYLEELRALYSSARDLASTQHGRFNAKRTSKLRVDLLQTGLDLSVVARDTGHLWSDQWRKWNGIQVDAIPTEHHSGNSDSFDLLGSLGEYRDSEFERLLDEDRNYRVVLSNAAALGASADAVRIGRLALYVAAGSMMVAAMTMMIAQTGPDSVWSAARRWLGWG